MSLILIIVVLVLLFGGGFGYYGYRNGAYGPGSFGGILGLLLVVVLILYFMGRL